MKKLLIGIALSLGITASAQQPPYVRNYYDTNADPALSITSSNLVYQMTSSGVTNTVLAIGTILQGTNNYGVNSTNLANAEWLLLQGSRLVDKDNWNRYAWKNTTQKIANHGQLRVLVEGSGLVQSGLLGAWYVDLTNQFPRAGTIGDFYPWWYKSANGGSTANGLTDTNWYDYYFIETADGDYAEYTAQSGFKWNILTVDYIVWPDGGTFKIQTNNGFGGGFSDTEVTVDTSGTRAGASVSWTNPAAVPLKLGVRITKSGAGGTNLVIHTGVLNTNTLPGLVIGQIDATSSGVLEMLAPGDAIRSPIISNWQPDLWVWQSIEGTNATFTTNMPIYLTHLQSNLPNTDIVLCGTYPVAFTTSHVELQNEYIRTNAIGRNVAYFDGWGAFNGDVTNTAFPRGFCASLADTVHWGTVGYAAYSYLFGRWMDLYRWQGVSSNDFVGSFTGDGSGLTNILAGSASYALLRSYKAGGYIDTTPGWNLTYNTTTEVTNLVADYFNLTNYGGTLICGPNYVSNTVAGVYEVEVGGHGGAPTATSGTEIYAYTNGVRCTPLLVDFSLGYDASEWKKMFIYLPANSSIFFKGTNNNASANATLNWQDLELSVRPAY